jgi:hypothetical protein
LILRNSSRMSSQRSGSVRTRQRLHYGGSAARRG